VYTSILSLSFAPSLHLSDPKPTVLPRLRHRPPPRALPARVLGSVPPSFPPWSTGLYHRKLKGEQSGGNQRRDRMLFGSEVFSNPRCVSISPTLVSFPTFLTYFSSFMSHLIILRLSLACDACRWVSSQKPSLTPSLTQKRHVALLLHPTRVSVHMLMLECIGITQTLFRMFERRRFEAVACEAIVFVLRTAWVVNPTEWRVAFFVLV
jgi:hypothetical protein